MPTPHKKLAESLAELEKLQTQTGGTRVFRFKERSRLHRERLMRAGFLQQGVRGWLIASAPGTAPGESTPWFTSFREFSVRYSQCLALLRMRKRKHCTHYFRRFLRCPL
jgi:hypothetical protein